jgi:hypothetical protein
MNEKIEFWDCSEDAELLGHESQDAAIEAYLDEALYNTPIKEWPKTVSVFGFAREKPKFNLLPARTLERVLEDLDEDYGNPEEATAETEGMKLAAEEFIQKIAAEYTVWSCKRVATEEISVMDWVKEHAPHWLEQPR